MGAEEDSVKKPKQEERSLSLSAQVNGTSCAELEYHRRRMLLVEMLDRLDHENGPVEESLVEKYVKLLE